MSTLDDEYGPPAGKGHVDPTHLRALAVRMEALAGIVELIKDRDVRRDEKLDGIRDKVDAIENEVESLLRNEKTFSEGQIKTLEDIIVARGRREWLWSGIKLYAGWGAAVVMFFGSAAAFGFFSYLSALLRRALS